ncbi:hypothetical protein GCM10007886_19720 [Methylobacterium gregans]|nr:hypothetical protein GCM10007886_19720 [Methylobacterium gregans]
MLFDECFINNRSGDLASERCIGWQVRICASGKPHAQVGGGSAGATAALLRDLMEADDWPFAEARAGAARYRPCRAAPFHDGPVRREGERIEARLYRVSA